MQENLKLKNFLSFFWCLIDVWEQIALGKRKDYEEEFETER